MRRDTLSRQAIDARLKTLSAQQEERLARHRAGLLRLPYINLAAFPTDANVLALVPREVARAAGAVLFYKKGRDVRIGVVNPQNEQVAELLLEIAAQLGVPPQVHVISEHSLEVTLARYAPERQEDPSTKDTMVISPERLSGFKETMASLKQLGGRISSVAPSEILSAIVAGAVSMRASDIHIEPRRDEAQLRYRIDGVLQNIASFARGGWQQVLSRIKARASLKLNVHSVPQDGSFVLQINDDAYDVRVSILPGAFGENIVLRLLRRQEEQAMTLSGLGMKERDYLLVLEELKRSTGMVLSAGPTGSGKTTTITACIRQINTPELKLITLEDPIEYRIPGVEQTEVDVAKGYTFAVGLRSILRQDPDAIFVGEMRDTETAETSIHAAMTGHLVFSTIHANDAPGVVLRIVDIGIKPYVLAPALNLVISQRLVRQLCLNCAETYVVPSQLRDRIREVMADVLPAVFNPAILDKRSLSFKRARGCTQCGETGYFGRIGVFEVFAVRDDIEELILAGADVRKIGEAAQRQGMTTIAQDAYLKVIDGVTTVAEVERISEE